MLRECVMKRLFAISVFIISFPSFALETLSVKGQIENATPYYERLILQSKPERPILFARELQVRSYLIGALRNRGFALRLSVAFLVFFLLFLFNTQNTSSERQAQARSQFQLQLKGTVHITV